MPYSRDDATGTINVTVREGLLQRLPKTKSRVVALDEIHEKLALATEFYLNHGDGGRFGVYRAMLDLVDYFASQGIPRATLEVIGAVAGAIIDADRGTASQIFKPERKQGSGKPPTRVLKLAFDGHLAVVMECCTRHLKAEGHRPYVGPASRLAAKLINQSDWNVTVTPTAVREIRERVQQCAANSPERIAFDQLLDSPIAKEHPLEWAKLMLSHDWVNPPPQLSA